MQKGFPMSATLDELEAFFKPHGKIAHILMRRLKNEDRSFKGSVFVTFADKDAAAAFLNDGPTKFKPEDENDLIRKWQ